MRLTLRPAQKTLMQIGASSGLRPRCSSPYLASQLAVPISAATYRNRATASTASPGWRSVATPGRRPWAAGASVPRRQRGRLPAAVRRAPGAAAKPAASAAHRAAQAHSTAARVAPVRSENSRASRNGPPAAPALNRSWLQFSMERSRSGLRSESRAVAWLSTAPSPRPNSSTARVRTRMSGTTALRAKGAATAASPAASTARLPTRSAAIPAASELTGYSRNMENSSRPCSPAELADPGQEGGEHLGAQGDGQGGGQAERGDHGEGRAGPSGPAGCTGSRRTRAPWSGSC